MHIASSRISPRFSNKEVFWNLSVVSQVGRSCHKCDVPPQRVCGIVARPMYIFSSLKGFPNPPHDEIFLLLSLVKDTLLSRVSFGAE